MQERNKDQNTNKPPAGENEMVNSGHSGQGVDKAPGEESAQDNVQFTQEAQKGKKTDADLSKESDRPGDQQL